MPNPVIAHYQDASGVRHDVVVRKTRAGAWQVADISVAKTTIIETLTGVDEGRPEAEAIAREYVREQPGAREKAAPGGRA
ncbi:MAG: hypothetical protein JO168_10770 [Solirubrobacterales bacterium]|nr:hypothetical protein [Solirubrobacterales bacterium]